MGHLFWSTYLVFIGTHAVNSPSHISIELEMVAGDDICTLEFADGRGHEEERRTGREMVRRRGTAGSRGRRDRDARPGAGSRAWPV